MNTKEITIISTTATIYSFGVRRLVSYLKKHSDCKIKVFFCVTSPVAVIAGRQKSAQKLSSQILSKTMQLVKDSPIVCFSVMTSTEPIAVEITTAVKRAYPDKVILWGGVHATTDPHRCLEFADYICVGEGEKALKTFIDAYYDGDDLSSIPGIWSKKGDEIIENKPLPLVLNLDELGYPAFNIPDSFIVRKNSIASLTKTLEKKFIGNTFWTMLTQGCPFQCSFCANKTLIGVQKDYAKVRYYSPQGFIAYLNTIKEIYDIQSFFFWDDLFFGLHRDVVKEFSTLWKTQIDTPFHILGVYPTTFNNELLDLLVNSGLKRIRIGIQSGSEAIRKKIYNRTHSNDLLIQISRKLSQSSISLCDYDFILDNPWETMDDRLEGLQLLSNMTPPFTINISHFTFFPGMELTQRALNEGLIKKDYKANTDMLYSVVNDYVNFLYAVYSVIHIPKKLLRILTNDNMLKLNIPIPKFLFSSLAFLKDFKILFFRFFHRDPTNVPVISHLILKKKKGMTANKV